jgi:hypothetical protein
MSECLIAEFSAGLLRHISHLNRHPLRPRTFRAARVLQIL